MAVSVRLDPLIEAKLTQQAALLGITKSDFIKDAIARAVGGRRVQAGRGERACRDPGRWCVRRLSNRVSGAAGVGDAGGGR